MNDIEATATMFDRAGVKYERATQPPGLTYAGCSVLTVERQTRQSIVAACLYFDEAGALVAFEAY